MKVILTKDVENLGFEFDVVTVKNGYGRNYLIPQKVAALATPKALEALNITMTERAAQEAALVASATEIANKVKAIEIKIPAKVGDGDKLFGSINNGDLADLLNKQGAGIDKKHIKLPGSTIKRLGKYVAKVRIHRGVEFDYEFEVVPEAVAAKAE